MSDAGRYGTLTNENASELLKEAINDGFNAAEKSAKEHPWSDVEFIAEVLLQSQWLAGVVADATIDETADAEKWNSLYVRAEERAEQAEAKLAEMEAGREVERTMLANVPAMIADAKAEQREESARLIEERIDEWADGNARFINAGLHLAAVAITAVSGQGGEK